MKISLAMIVKDEENNIKKCLESVNCIVDEIILVDTGSLDNTVNIAKLFGAKVFKYTWCDDFAAARNYALNKCSGDWILVLDADEYVSIGSRATLEEFEKNNNEAIGRIAIRSNYMIGEEETYSKEYISRFFPKGIRYKGIIHENLESQLKRVEINFQVEHRGYLNTNKSERNLPLLFKELNENKNDSYILYQIARTLYVEKRYEEALAYFAKCYPMVDHSYSYSKSLVIDYLYSIVNSNSSYEFGLKLIEKEEDNYKGDSDFNFVCGIFYLNLIIYDENKYSSYFPLIKNSYLKCLELGDKNSLVEGVGSFRAAYNLGTFFEAIGDYNSAYRYYEKSGKDFMPARKRLDKLKK